METPSITGCNHCGFGSTGTTNLPPSPVRELLGTNKIPNPSQERSIRDVLASVQADNARLESEIERVRSVLEHLQSERNVIQAYIEEHRALLTPARRLYPELIAEIFQHCSKGAERKRLHDILDSFDPRQGPLLLAHICSEWRSVALSTPNLWTLIRVVIRRPRPAQLSLVEMWLSHSRELPLTIGIMERKPGAQPPTYPSVDWSNNQALAGLVRESRRWETVQLMFPPSTVTWGSFATIKNNVPLLRSLTLNVSRGMYSSNVVLDLFENTPRLKHLALDYAFPLSIVKVPCAQLMSLELSVHRQSPTSINWCLEALYKIPILRECVLHCGAFEPWHPFPMKVEHAFLRKLSIFAEPLRDGGFGDGLRSLFVRMTLPNLRSLTVQSTSNARDWDHEPFVDFLSRSPHLEELTLKCDTDVGDLAEALRETPNVHRLIVHCRSRGLDNLLRQLAGADEVYNAPNFLTKLSSLELVDLDGTALPSFFIDMLKNRAPARTHGRSPLQSVTLECPQASQLLTDRNTLQLIELGSNNLDLRIKQQSGMVLTMKPV
ncbi:hypothetical protein BDQ12DRAFT_708886 [Crucibulum laeve]|uniref:F-box domain-containing protein n=1 Tax=Crucibulum laeve TaxID=68775 RepID=A0A5C3MME4_9AGAR|nr:hypothetical protein BDQ12DRAFT_708886 [Crucibulum laeve]